MAGVHQPLKKYRLGFPVLTFNVTLWSGEPDFCLAGPSSNAADVFSRRTVDERESFSPGFPAAGSMVSRVLNEEEIRFNSGI
ncbi:hypothetical protein JCM14469_23730 [Desulfatiferula olefinivorans]